MKACVDCDCAIVIDDYDPQLSATVSVDSQLACGDDVVYYEGLWLDGQNNTTLYFPSDYVSILYVQNLADAPEAGTSDVLVIYKDLAGNDVGYPIANGYYTVICGVDSSTSLCTLFSNEAIPIRVVAIGGKEYGHETGVNDGEQYV